MGHRRVAWRVVGEGGKAGLIDGIYDGMEVVGHGLTSIMIDPLLEMDFIKHTDPA